MSNLEYERSFNVKNIEPFIKFCESNDFVKTFVSTQNRIVFENKHNSKIIARLTTEIKDNKQSIVIDFKNVNSKKDNLNISTESIPMIVTDDNKECVMSILNTLDFFEVANNIRTRYEYIKDDVKFEIDDYTRPDMKVVAIEGERQAVEHIYEQLKQYINIK